jgi:hypothetical protein
VVGWAEKELQVRISFLFFYAPNATHFCGRRTVRTTVGVDVRDDVRHTDLRLL